MKYEFDSKDGITSVSDNTCFRTFASTRETIGEIGMKAMQIIGSEGISEEQDQIRQIVDVFLFSKGIPLSRSAVRRCVESLKLTGLLKAQEVNTGIRRFNINKFTPEGNLFFFHYFQKRPVKFEHEKLIEEHASLHHGYMIKDAAEILKSKGIYDEISTSRTGNRYQLSDGRACIPDIVCKMDWEKYMFEVECGTHKQCDFNSKCSKLMEITCDIYIIAQNRKVLNKILRHQVENWIAEEGRENLLNNGTKVYLATLVDLKNDKWSYIYDMTSDKPVCSFDNTEKEGGEDA